MSHFEEQETKVYIARDIMKMLHIGRSKAYDFLDQAYKTQKPFRVMKVGTCVRVPKQSFDAWFASCAEDLDV